MQRIKAVMSDVQTSNFGRDIPIILRTMCQVEVGRLMHTVPPDHAHNPEPLRDGFIEAARSSVENADLVLIPGGFDINPAIYGQERGIHTDKTPELCYRDEVESVMIKTAMELDIPIVHICRGYQLGLALMIKDTKTDLVRFCQHLPDVTTGRHRADFFAEGKEIILIAQYVADQFVEDLQLGKSSPILMEKDLVHKVRIYPGTISHWLYKKALELKVGDDEPIEVNETSHHHQGIIINKDLQMPDSYICSALSLAGDEVPVMEGFERTDKSFCVGFQWHLEANATGKVGKIFQYIADYAEFRKGNKSVPFLEWAADSDKKKAR